GIDCICALNKSPIDEIFEIKKFTMEHLKDEKSSPQHQLQKYYPKIFDKLKKNQFGIMQDCITTNLSRGVKEGYYRGSINIEFISRLYFSTMMRSEEHTSELQSRENLVCRLLLEKK